MLSLPHHEAFDIQQCQIPNIVAYKPEEEECGAIETIDRCDALIISLVMITRHFLFCEREVLPDYWYLGVIDTYYVVIGTGTQAE